MKKTVFYSWQSDLPNNSNWGFIEKALRKAANAISDDDSIEVEPVIDRDTFGIGGSPDISATIFSKIAKADVFVADVSIINKNESGRKVPNPNVLIELGYALSELGYEKVILVMNLEYGGIDLLPFDLKTKRILSYNTTKDKQLETNTLVSKLQAQFKTIFETNDKQEDKSISIIEAIKSQRLDRLSTARAYIQSLNKEIESYYPGDGILSGQVVDPEYDQKIIDAINMTLPLVSLFRNIIDEVSIFNDIEVLKQVFKGFRPLAEHFNRKRGDRDGTHHRAEFDYYRFLGNELYVILVSILLRDEKWELLKYILTEPIVIDNLDGDGPGAADFSYFSEYAEGFHFRKVRLGLNRASLRFDLLVERRSAEKNINSKALEEYTSADLFLYLIGESGNVNNTESIFKWRPWSLTGFDLPMFILMAQRKSYAEDLARTMGVSSVQDIQILLKNKVHNIGKNSGVSFWRNPISDNHINLIGTR
jgi:hypothetical protein